MAYKMDDYFAGDLALVEAAKERQAKEAAARQAGQGAKAQSIGTGAGTILGAIVGGMAGNPLLGASLGGSLGSAAAGIMRGGNAAAAAPAALGKADQLWNMYKKSQKGNPIEDATGLQTSDLFGSNLGGSMMA